MKKLLLSVFAAFVALGVKAESEVTFNFDDDATALFGIEGRSSGNGNSYVADGEFTENGVATIDGVTITVEASAEDAKPRNRLWATSPVLRMYNGTLTVAAPGHNVTKIVFVGNSNFNMEVNTGTLDGKTWVSDEAVAEVIFTVTKNTQLKSMTVTLDGEIGEEPPVIELSGTGEGTVESPYDVERALSIIANDVCSNDAVYIKGEIATIDEVNLEYGNATYIIAQGESQLKIYRGYNLGGEKFTAEDEIKVGDEVVVCGKLVTNYGGQVTTGSSIYSINGETAPEEPPYTVVGNGTKENPYTVADIQHMKVEESDGNSYWVKGYILGSCSSASKLNDAESAVDTNIALGATADATEFIPVALPNNGIREVLGVATNPENVGKEVMVYGTLEKYFSTAGVKNVTECVIDGETVTSTIDAIDTTVAPVKYYNIQGIEVANPQSGQLYIRVQGEKVTKVIR